MTSVRSEYAKTLRRLPLFNDLSDGELDLVAEGVSRIRFAEGSVIFSEGELCRQLFVVEDGEVKLIKATSDGRQQLLSIERRGGALAEVAVFDGGRYPATAEAVRDTTLLCLPAESIRKICAKNPEMALKIFKVLAHRLRHLVRLVEDLSFSTIRARLIAHLLHLAEQNGESTPRGICFKLTENNEQLAARLGTVRELVSRNLGRLHGERLIQIDKRTIRIPNIAVLRAEIERAH